MADEKRKRTGDRKRLQAGDEEGYGVVVSGDLPPEACSAVRESWQPTTRQLKALQHARMHVHRNLTHAELAEAAGVPIERVHAWFSSARFRLWWAEKHRELVTSLDADVALVLYRAAHNSEAETVRVMAADRFLRNVGFGERKADQQTGLAGLFGLLRGAPAGTEVALGVRVGGRPETSVSGHPDAVESPRTARVRVEGEGVPEISGKTPEPHSAPPPPAARISPPPSRPPRIKDE